jgi:hypothetical protein
VWILMKIAYIFALLLTGCGPTIVHLDRPVADPPYPPVLIQHTGGECGWQPQSFAPQQQCILPKPTGAGDSMKIVVTVAHPFGGVDMAVTDDANDNTFRVIQTGTYPPHPFRQYFVLQGTVAAGAQTFTVNTQNPQSTIYDIVLLDYSGGSLTNQGSGSCYVQPGNSCQPIQTSAINVNPNALLLGIELGEGGSLSPSNCPWCGGVGSNDPTSTGTMQIIYQKNSDQLCSSNCSLYVIAGSTRTGGSQQAVFQFDTGGQPLANNSGWTATVGAFQ